MKKSFEDLSVYNSKAGKRFMPVDNLAEYAGHGEEIFAELGMAGLVRKRNHEGFKIRVPAKLFTSSKFGRFMWISRKSDFEGFGRDIQEAKPVFGLTSEGARELMRLHALRYGSKDADAPDTDMCDIDEIERETNTNKNAAKPQKGDKI